MKADKYVPPHLRNEETRQSVSKMPSETENTPNSQIDEINKKTDKYVPPHLRNKETRQSVSKMPSETESTPTNPINTQMDENNKKVDQYVLSHLKTDESNQSVSTMPFETKIISPATASSSSLVICNWKTKRVIKLLRRYTKYKTELSRPDVKEAREQTLWRKIAYDSDLSLSRDKIDELRCEYERIKNMKVKNRETAIFLDEAKIAFETTETTEKAKPVKMLDFKKSNKDFLRKLLQVYAKHKTEPACPHNEEQIVWEKITKEMREKFSYACGEKLCRFELLQLKCQYESSKRKNIKYGNMIYLFQDAEEAFEISENLVISPVTASSSLPVYCNWEMKMIIKLLRLYTNYKPEFSHPDIEEQTVWKKIAQELQEQNYDESEQNYDESECHNKIDELRCVYKNIINKNVTNRETAMFLDEAKKAFDTTEITEESKPLLLLGIKKSNKDFLRKLLKVYAKYKTELACPNDEEQKVWEKIAKEMREKFSYDCGETLCRFELLELKCQYESLKRAKIKNVNMFWFFHDAEEAFETPENLDTSNTQIDAINKKVDENLPPHLSNEENRQSVSAMPSETEIISSVNASSSLSEQNCSWNKKRIFKVLQLYTKYKAELSHPDIKKVTVWKKIAYELRNCDELQCFNKIYELRCEYERIKNENVTNRETAIFLDEAKKAFETTETTGETKPLFMLSLKRSNKDLLRKLLQVYAKYKTELACHNNNEDQKVWERIAKEMREKFSYSCGETLCRFELLQLKFQYESLKRDGVKSENMIYLFHDAEEAFETAENLDTSNSQIDEINKKVDEYVPPHLNSEENRQSVSTTPSETESIPPVNLCKLPSKNSQWKRKRCLVLLQVYAKYKTELSCSSVEEKHEVWKKIAKEVCQRCSFKCSELQCMYNIDKMKREYFALKCNPKTAINDKITLFLNEASNAFETSGNSGLQR